MNKFGSPNPAPIFFGFINIFMNYLTNYYRNLSEQLQERVNQLQVALNEYYAPGMERAKMDQKAKLTLAQSLGQVIKKLEKEEDSTTQVGNLKQLPSTEPREGKAVPFSIKQPREELIRSQEAKQTSESMPYSEREELDTNKEYNIDTNSIIKQTPDGRMIYGESRPKPTQQPNANYNSPYPMKNLDKKFQLFQTKETSPDLGRYGRNDGIDIMPEPRKDLVSSVNTESSPAFNIDLNLLRDKKLSDPRNRDEIDFSEIKKKLSRVAKNI